MGELRIPEHARGFTYYQDTPPENPSIGDTWYDTSSGMGYVYEGGWVPYKKDSECWEKNPAYLKIEPFNATIYDDGGSVSFTVTIKNMDVGVCGNTTFTLTVHDSNTDDFEPSTLSQTTVTLGPYQEAAVTLTVTDKVGAAIGSGRNDVYVVATATDHPASQSNTVTVELSDAAAECTPQAPSVSISPATQTITTDGGSVSYTVTITNNDPTSCTDTTFTLTVNDSDTTHFEPSTLSQTSVTLAPGASTTVTLTVTDKANDYPGSPVSNNTYVTVTSTAHGSVNSNTVTTTIDGDAVTAKPGYGYVCGGYIYSNGDIFYSIIDRFTFPFDSGTATHVGNLTRSTNHISACASSTHSYVCGGYYYSGSAYFLSAVDRFAFPFDSGTAEYVGDLSAARNATSSCASSTHGYVCGGYDGSDFTTIDRFAFPFDSGTALHVGNLGTASRLLSACFSSTCGYVCGGYNGTTVYLSSINRFTFPFDSGTATHVGDLSSERQAPVAYPSSTHGYVCGGRNSVGYFSAIDRFTFPFDSGTTVHVANLSEQRFAASACSSDVHGYTCGGYYNDYTSIIDRLTFYSGTVTRVGDLSVSRAFLAATSDTDPHLRW